MRARTPSIVADPFDVERSFAWGESSIDRLAVHLGRPLEIRPVQPRRIGMARTTLFATSVVARSHTACRDVTDVSQLAGQFAVTPFVGLESSCRRLGRHGASTSSIPTFRSDSSNTVRDDTRAGRGRGARTTWWSFETISIAAVARWGDALFELADAVLCRRDRSPRCPPLSLEPEFRRSHGSLYKALERGRIDEDRLRELLVSKRPRPGRLSSPSMPRPGTAVTPNAVPNGAFTTRRPSIQRASPSSRAGPISGSASWTGRLTRGRHPST